MNIDLTNLIDECVQVEYKQEVCDGLFKTISGFSNSDGGCILLGVKDGTKNIVVIYNFLVFDRICHIWWWCRWNWF